MMITFADILAARECIASYIHRTPVLTCSAIDEMAGRALFFKCENFQKVGAFKFRGACNAIMSLDDATAGRGVVTHSSGNHAQAVALAAKLRGVPAHIVMPTNANPVKKRAVAGYGARIINCEPTLESREETASRVLEETGATLIHPYNDPRIIAGQGTCALELLEEHTDLDAVIAPVGGGGLISGTCIVAHAIGSEDKPSPPAPLPEGEGSIRIFGAEPKGADDAARSLAAGRIIPQTNPQTIADGLRTSLGTLTFSIIREHVEKIITVSDDEIIRAMRLIWERMKIIIEPSSAVVLAAILSDEFRALDGIGRIGVILSGGNVDLNELPWRR